MVKVIPKGTDAWSACTCWHAEVAQDRQFCPFHDNFSKLIHVTICTKLLREPSQILMSSAAGQKLDVCDWLQS